MICQELEIPLFIVPRESSIFCAAGMLMSDLQHDFVRSFVSNLDGLDWAGLNHVVNDMKAEGDRLLDAEKIPPERRRYHVNFDCRYVKQYHEVSFPVPPEAVAAGDLETIAPRFHAEHNRMYGYSLENEGTPIELINVRLRAVGLTEKPAYREEERAGADPSAALKGERAAYIPERTAMRTVPVYDGHRTRHGHRIAGPGIIEQVNTTLFLSESFDCVSDRYGSFVVHVKGRDDLVEPTRREVKAS